MLTTIGKQTVAITITIMLAIAAWSSYLDTPATDQVDVGLKRAIVTFATARALNSAISLAQGTEFTVGIGAQLTLSIGEILDPLNDMVESLSDVMLLASVAFGIQKVLLAIGQHVFVKWTLICVLAVWLGTLLMTKTRPRWIDMSLVLILMVRFAVPVVTIGSDAIYRHFLQQKYAEGQRDLQNAKDDVNATTEELSDRRAPTPNTTAPCSQVTQTPSTENRSRLDRTSDWIDEKLGDAKQATRGLMQGMDPRPDFERLKERVDGATEQLVNLIVLSLLQTVLAPLFLVWALYVALRNIVAPKRSS